MIHCRFCEQGNACPMYNKEIGSLKPTADSEYDHDEAQAVGDMAKDCGSYVRKVIELQ